MLQKEHLTVTIEALADGREATVSIDDFLDDASSHKADVSGPIAPEAICKAFLAWKEATNA